jgi:hypothetical protein
LQQNIEYERHELSVKKKINIDKQTFNRSVTNYVITPKYILNSKTGELFQAFKRGLK